MSCFTGMMRWMAVISTDQQQILRELKAIRGMISARKVTEEEDIEFTSLPLTSDVELQLFEEDLKDKKRRNVWYVQYFMFFSSIFVRKNTLIRTI